MEAEVIMIPLQRRKLLESRIKEVYTYQAAPKMLRPMARPIPMLVHAYGLIQ